MFGVNVAGTFWMCQAAIPHLESHGNIVNVASNAGLMGMAYTTVYASSKAAVVNMTRSLAMEFIRTPLRINAVAPGGINTAMAQATFFPEDTNWKLVVKHGLSVAVGAGGDRCGDCVRCLARCQGTAWCNCVGRRGHYCELVGDRSPAGVARVHRGCASPRDGQRDLPSGSDAGQRRLISWTRANLSTMA